MSEICIIQRIFRIDDALFRRIVECLRLFHIAARTDARLLADLGLIQKRGERLAFAAIGGELISGRQYPEVRHRHSQHQTFLRALKTGLGRRHLEIRFLQLTEGLEAPQRLRDVESEGVRRAVAILRAGRGADGAVRGLAAQCRSVVVAGAYSRGLGIGGNLRQPLGNRLRPRFDQRIALEMGRLQRRVASQRELVVLPQIVGRGEPCRQSQCNHRP